MKYTVIEAEAADTGEHSGWMVMLKGNKPFETKKQAQAERRKLNKAIAT